MHVRTELVKYDLLWCSIKIRHIFRHVGANILYGDHVKDKDRLTEHFLLI